MLLLIQAPVDGVILVCTTSFSSSSNFSVLKVVHLVIDMYFGSEYAAMK